jgi:hypothetical protein
MSRDVCGICWCPYDEDGRCGCKPAKVIDPAADEALLRRALEIADEYCGGRCNAEQNPCWAREVADAIKERLK